MDTDPFRVFLDMHLKLTRNAPGSDTETRARFDALEGLPQAPEMLAMGCGQGCDVMVLLEAAQGRVTAVDMLKPFLEKLEAKAEAAGISGERLLTVCSEYAALDLPDGHFDLLWSEGAIYTQGFEAGLKDWARYLKPGGLAVISNAFWLVDEPSKAARAFWEADYPEMAGVEEDKARATGAGFEVLSTHVLPQEDWWTDYYQPLIPLIADARAEFSGDAPVQAMLDEQEKEIRLFEQASDEYGYVFFTLKKAA